MKNKIKWADRHISRPAPYIALCFNQKEYNDVIDWFGIDHDRSRFINNGAHATTHVLIEEGSFACIVCLGDIKNKSVVEVYGLLAHESVHIWQAYVEKIGETRPGDEQEAYAVQAVFQSLMTAFLEKSKKVKKKK